MLNTHTGLVLHEIQYYTRIFNPIMLFWLKRLESLGLCSPGKYLTRLFANQATR